MRMVWHNFTEWILRHVPAGEVATLVAWNGAACNMKWLWVLTQAPNLPYMMPPQLQFFIDPYRVIKKYALCKINKKRSKLESYQLGSVWTYLDKEHCNLNNAHNSRDDVIAQSAVLTHEDFIPFINWAKSVQTIDDIFTAAQKNNWRKKMEPLHEVHKPWKEVTKDNDIKWEPQGQDQYGSAGGGPKMGPSNYIVTEARSA
jgi:hypothetical protein